MKTIVARIGSAVAVLLMFGPSLHAQLRGAAPQQMEMPMKVPRAAMDLLAFEGNPPDSSRADLYLAMPFSALDFQFAVDNYVADYSVDVRVVAGDRMVMDRYETYNVLETIEAYRDRIARGDKHADAEQISLMLPADSLYRFQVAIVDLSTKHEFDTTMYVHLPNFRAARTTMSDLMLYRDRTGQNIVPFIGPDVSDLEERETDEPAMSASASSGIFAMLYHAPPDSEMSIVTEVVARTKSSSDSLAPVLFKYAMPFRTQHESVGLLSPGPIPQVPLFVPLRLHGLWPGHFRLQTYLLPSIIDTALSAPDALERRALASAHRECILRIASGIPESLMDMDLAIEQLRIIATDSEWDVLSNAKAPKEKREAILQFWRGRTEGHGFASSIGSSYSSHAMDVFYSRIEYANAHFSSNFGLGWKSDRGRVFIQLGQPEDIKDQTGDYRMRTVEVWTYAALGYRFEFVDEYDLGDFHLHGALPPSGTFIADR
ncbi:MAG TPA: GWxTD domain-containing protein [Candidatus Kapabacteria bacterium]|jgi:GWxTD domain-containing protein